MDHPIQRLFDVGIHLTLDGGSQLYRMVLLRLQGHPVPALLNDGGKTVPVHLKVDEMAAFDGAETIFFPLVVEHKKEALGIAAKHRHSGIAENTGAGFPIIGMDPDILLLFRHL